MGEAADPEGLSLKLRKMFPMIEERGGDMSPVTSDFSQIVELQQFRRLYEEQEEKTKLRLTEKDEEMAELRGVIRARDQQIEEFQARMQAMAQDRDRLRSHYNPLPHEPQPNTAKLMKPLP